MLFKLDELRENVIKLGKIQGLENIERLNDDFIFYYDETNNIRKLYLSEKSLFNIKTDDIFKNFVVGGICFRETPSQEKINDLKSALKLQQSIKEIKLKHIAKGDFIECLNSKKLTIFLDWIYDNSYLHFSSINLLFWSIVDIIDSLMDNENYEVIILNKDLKTILYEIVKNNMEKFSELFFAFNYPNIKKDKVNEFLEHLITLIQSTFQNVDLELLKIDQEIFNDLSTILIGLLEKSKNEDLPFIMYEKDKILIDSLFDFYLRPIYTFINSEHNFDDEQEIKKIFNKYEFTFLNKRIKLNFINSENNDFIQFSDVIVGFIGKMYEYLNKSLIRDIERDLKNFNELQKTNLFLLRKLIEKSDNYCKGFIHLIEPLTEKIKLEILLKQVI